MATKSQKGEKCVVTMHNTATKDKKTIVVSDGNIAKIFVVLMYKFPVLFRFPAITYITFPPFASSAVLRKDAASGPDARKWMIRMLVNGS